MGAKCCFEIFNEFRLLCCLNFMGQECAGIVPMLAKFSCSVYIYWDDILSHFPDDLTQSELQQGSDRLNCDQKQFLMLYAIKINCIYINEQVESIFRVICAPIRSWRDISAQHFPSLPPGELCFWRPKISSRRPKISSPRPEILYRLINMYQLKILSCPGTWVTMSAMPPVDNYITIFLLKNRDRP